MGDGDLGASGSGRHGSRRVRPLAETRLHCLPSMAATSPILICRERVVSIQPQENHAGFVLANQAKILLRPFLAGYIGIGDEIAFPVPTGDTIRAEMLITKNSGSGPNRYLYHVPIGYVSHPKQDKRNQHFVSAEVQPGSLGIGSIFVPCEVLREYFYRPPRTADRVDHPNLYEVLRIPTSASPAELRVAFKLRDLELRTASARHREQVALERAFNIVGQPELRACYDALLADPEAPAIFPYGGFGSLLVAGEPSRDGKTFFARRILAFSPDLRRRRFHVPLRKCDFYDDRALCRDVRRKLEFWLDPAALHTLWDRTWNQWKHLLGTKIEVEGTFVQSGKYRKRRERVGTRHLGNCVAEPVGGQTATRFPAANGICQNCLSSLRPVFAGSGSDPAVLGTSGGRASGAAANVFRVACSRETLMSPRSAGALIMTRSSIASSHAGHAGSICFGMNTFSTLRKPSSSKPLSLATRLTSSPSPGAWIAFSLCTPRSRRTTSGETAIMQPSGWAFWGA